MISYGVVIFCLVLGAYCNDWSETAKDAIDAQKAENEGLRRELTRLGRQLMLQQFFTEERIRSEGSSGKSFFVNVLHGDNNFDYIQYELSLSEKFPRLSGSSSLVLIILSNILCLYFSTDFSSRNYMALEQ